MKRLAENLINDVTTVLNRPVFTKEEEEALVSLFSNKIQKVLEDNIYSYKKETENLMDFIELQVHEGDYYDILF